MKKSIAIFTILLLCALGFSGCEKKEYNTFGTLYGTVIDVETGDPVSNASVLLSPGGKSKTTGSEGTYEFNDLDARQYTITVQKTGYQTNLKTVTAVAGEKTEANIPLTKSE
jgi:hypothetical protein